MLIQFSRINGDVKTTGAVMNISTKTAEAILKMDQLMGTNDLMRLRDYEQEFNTAMSNLAPGGLKWGSIDVPKTISLGIFSGSMQTHSKDPESLAKDLLAYRLKQAEQKAVNKADKTLINGIEKIESEIKKLMDTKEKTDKKILEIINKHKIDPKNLADVSSLKRSASQPEREAAVLLEKSNSYSSDAKGALSDAKEGIHRVWGQGYVSAHVGEQQLSKLEKISTLVHSRSAIENLIKSQPTNDPTAEQSKMPAQENLINQQRGFKDQLKQGRQLSRMETNDLPDDLDENTQVHKTTRGL